MNLLFDLHTHTIMSGHAYSSMQENIVAAYEKGLSAYGFSDHAPALKGAPTDLYFENLRILQRRYKEMRVYAGIEGNILDYTGKVDIGEKSYASIDYAIASMHSVCIKPGTLEQNTAGYIGAMQNEYVKIIGHPDDSRFPVDYDELVKAAVFYKVALEVNNSSLLPTSGRKGGRENILTLLDRCRKYGAKIVCGSDAHVSYLVGEFQSTCELLKEIDFPEELVLNTSLDGLDYVINKNLYNQTG